MRGTRRPAPPTVSCRGTGRFRTTRSRSAAPASMACGQPRQAGGVGAQLAQGRRPDGVGSGLGNSPATVMSNVASPRRTASASSIPVSRLGDRPDLERCVVVGVDERRSRSGTAAQIDGGDGDPPRATTRHPAQLRCQLRVPASRSRPVHPHPQETHRDRHDCQAARHRQHSDDHGDDHGTILAGHPVELVSAPSDRWTRPSYRDPERDAAADGPPLRRSRRAAAVTSIAVGQAPAPRRPGRSRRRRPRRGR